MNAVLSIPSKSVKEIAEKLNIQVFYKSIPSDTDLLIRWGSRKFSSSEIETLNSPEAIGKASNKALCRKILAEKEIPVPLNGTDRFPCIGRPSTHTRGRKFFVCRSDSEVRRAIRLGCTYFSEFYPKTREYRVHVGHGKIIFISEKVGGDSKFVWSHRKGYIFEVVPRGEYRPEIYRLAKAAIKALELDFGAVDIMSDAPGDYPKAVVCEVNTAPALSPYGVDKYVEYFNKVLNEYY